MKRFEYRGDDRTNIEKSLHPISKKAFEEAIFKCEYIASIILYYEDLYYNHKTIGQTKKKIREVLKHLGALIETVGLIGVDDEASSDNAIFWAGIISDRNIEKYAERRVELIRSMRSARANYLILERFLTRRSGNYLTDVLSESGKTTYFLREASCIFYHDAKKKPGRSKSTIGPFVRFAYAALMPILGTRTPSLESLNERWARMQFDPSRSRLAKTAMDDANSSWTA